MKKIVLWLFCSFTCISVLAQPHYGKETLVSMSDMLRYQRAKSKASKSVGPFSKYDFRRIRASKVLSEGDPRSIWGYRIHANAEYNKEKEPLYKLFRKEDFASMAVIDYAAEAGNKCEMVFWGKKYYRRFAHELRRMGFEMRNSSKHTNVLECRKKDIDVGVDITIWPDIYIMTFLIVGSE